MTDIYRGPRDNGFVNMIKRFLERGKLKSEYISELLSQESLSVWDAVFTSEEANPGSNSEIYEFLGDGSINNALVFYILRRFPQLKCSKGVKVLARLKINMVSRDYFSSIATTLGFEPYITSKMEERNDMRKLLEDCLEASFGALVWMLDEKIRIGVGNSIAYNILASVLDEREISLEYTSLFDAITRLKELFDVSAFKDRGIGTMKKIEGGPNAGATNPMDAFYAIVSRETQGKIIEVIGRATGPTLSDAKQAAASKAIEMLNARGFRKEIAPEYLRFCRY